jgi:hypothetical protein
MFHKWRRISLLSSIFWIFIAFSSLYTFWKLLETKNKLLQSQSEVDKFKLEIETLKNRLEIMKVSERVKKDLKLLSQCESEPSKQYETSRRRIRRDVDELWFFIRSKLEFARNEDFEKTRKSFLNSVLKDARHRYNAIITGFKIVLDLYFLSLYITPLYFELNRLLESYLLILCQLSYEMLKLFFKLSSAIFSPLPSVLTI